ncbi:unnamed protein product [Camellia sinensis]
MEMEAEEESPTELNTINTYGGFLNVFPDKLSVQYTNVNLHGHDVGVVQANRPAPVKRLVYYFEIYVKNAGAKGQTAIGFTTEGFKMRRQPGWEANSYGYHGDDGFLYRGQGKGESFGPTFTTGDTVGSGETSALFILIKVKEVVMLFSCMFDFDAVGSMSTLGMNRFSLISRVFEVQERAKQQTMIEKMSIPQNVSYGLIKNGKIEDAFDKLRDWMMHRLPAFCFIVKNLLNWFGGWRVEEAVAYGRMKFDKFYRLKEYEELGKLFVGGLGGTTDDQDLVQAFSGYGDIVESRIIKNRETGKSKGYGFVKFKDEQAMRDAIEGMHGQHLAGRNITVSEAKTRGSGGGVGLRSHGGGSNRGRGGGGAGRDGGCYGGGRDRGCSEGSGGPYSRGGGSDILRSFGKEGKSQLLAFSQLLGLGLLFMVYSKRFAFSYFSPACSKN